VKILCEDLDIVIYEDPAKVVGGGEKKRTQKKEGREPLSSFVNVL